MKITVGKNFSSNILFYLSYGIYLTVAILSTSFYAIYIENISKYVLAFCGVSLIANEIVHIRKYSLLTICWTFILLVVLTTVVITGSNAIWITFALLYAYMGREIHFRTIAKFTIIIESLMVFFVVSGALLGVIENYTVLGNRRRSYIGFLYALYPSAYIFNITALLVYLADYRIKWKRVLFLFLINLLVFITTNSRLSFFLALFVLLVSLFLKYNPYFLAKKRIILKILTLSFVMCCFLSFYLSITYNPSNHLMKELNSFLSNRLVLGRNAFFKYGFSLFGQDVAFHGFGLSSTGKISTETYDYVDNLYIQTLINFGVIFLVIYLFIHTLALIRSGRQHDYILFCVLVTLALHGLIDDLTIRLHYNTFWFVIGPLVFTRRKERLLS